MKATESKTLVSRLSDWVSRLVQRCSALVAYCTTGVWDDTRDNWKIKVVKTANLTVKSFFNSDLQSSACAMTYRTMLAIVPALALIFAIGRGFGFQNLIESEMAHYTHGQERIVEMVLKFVDSYLAQASEGIFVGVGIVFLLGTLVMLLSSVEDSFNMVWGVTDGRSWWRKLTDYTAILVILPILMLCASGLTLMMSSALKAIMPYDFMSPVVSFTLEAVSWLLTWVFFAGAYILIPNAKVKIVPALIAGVLAGSAFRLVGWLFMTGQLYVTKYNAIYGSFSFLPLLLIWIQLAWLITLTGALICCSAQNIYRFDFGDRIDHISFDYSQRAALAVMTIIAQRFESGLAPLNPEGLGKEYALPPRLVEKAMSDLRQCGLLIPVTDGHNEVRPPMVPAKGLDNYTASAVILALRNRGDSGFMPLFSSKYGEIDAIIAAVDDSITRDGATLLTDVKINV